VLSNVYTGRGWYRVSDLAGLLAIWAFVQVLFAWCLNRWGKVQALKYKQYVISPERNQTASDATGRHHIS